MYHFQFLKTCLSYLVNFQLHIGYIAISATQDLITFISIAYWDFLSYDLCFSSFSAFLLPFNRIYSRSFPCTWFCEYIRQTSSIISGYFFQLYKNSIQKVQIYLFYIELSSFVCYTLSKSYKDTTQIELCAIIKTERSS